jgi:hypothetical protein
MKMLLATLWVVVATLVTSCESGGGGISGTGVIESADDVSVGIINGFGSVIVNQQRLDSNSAEIIVNGVSSLESDLRIGMQVQVRANFDSLVAQRIEYVPLVIGPVAGVDLIPGVLDVLGHDILVNASTRYEGVAEGSIPLNTVVEVSGFTTARRKIVATFIRAVQNPGQYQLLATLNTRNPGVDVTIDFSRLEVLLNSGDLEFELLDQLGEFDRFPSRQAVLALPVTSQTTSLTASLSYLVPREPFIRGAQANILQTVLQTFPDGSFKTEGFTIITSADTVFTFEGGALATSADATPDQIVKVIGVILSYDGAVRARQVEIQSMQ